MQPSGGEATLLGLQEAFKSCAFKQENFKNGALKSKPLRTVFGNGGFMNGNFR